MSEMDYTPIGDDYDYSQDVCTPDDAPEHAAAAHEIYDPPIEHDPIGQALVGLPIALVTGLGEAAITGAEAIGAVGEEVFAWGIAELGIGGVEAATE